jgi:hypothetical protein
LPITPGTLRITATTKPIAANQATRFAARSTPSKDQFLSERKKVAGRGILIGRKVRIRFRNFVCLTFLPRPSHCLAIVTTAENRFLAANDNHDIANRRILITLDRNFRLSVFAGHRNIFLCPKAGLYFIARKLSGSITSVRHGYLRWNPGSKSRKAPALNSSRVRT